MLHESASMMRWDRGSRVVSPTNRVSRPQEFCNPSDRFFYGFWRSGQAPPEPPTTPPRSLHFKARHTMARQTESDRSTRHTHTHSRKLHATALWPPWYIATRPYAPLRAHRPWLELSHQPQLLGTPLAACAHTAHTALVTSTHHATRATYHRNDTQPCLTHCSGPHVAHGLP